MERAVVQDVSALSSFECILTCAFAPAYPKRRSSSACAQCHPSSPRRRGARGGAESRWRWSWWQAALTAALLDSDRAVPRAVAARAPRCPTRAASTRVAAALRNAEARYALESRGTVSHVDLNQTRTTRG